MPRDLVSEPPQRRLRRSCGSGVVLLLCLTAAACAGDLGTQDAGSAAAGERQHAATAAATPAPTLAPSRPGTSQGGAAAPTPDAGSERTALTDPQGHVCVDGAGCFGQPHVAGTFDVTAVPGASGLAASARNPGILWLLDDRPGTAEVWAMRTTGDLLGAVTVAGLEARDTESLAVGPCGPRQSTTCVYVGDIGDNRRARPSIEVHRFEEPDLSGGVPGEAVRADVARLTYPPPSPGGQASAHDAEALLVDPGGGLLVVTKAAFDASTGETGRARLFAAERFGDAELVDHGPVILPQPAQPLHSLVVGNVVTGADARDGRVLLRTYDQVVLYVAPDPRAPLRSFPSWPAHSLPAALEPQSEAIAWAGDGCGYYTVGEQVGDLWSVPCRP